MLHRAGLKWGIILGAAVSVWTLAIHAMGFYTTRIRFGLIADNVVTILPVAAVTLALLEHRRRTGALTIRQSVTLGFIVGIVSAPITVGFLWIYHHYINPGWVDYLVEHATAQAAANGSSSGDVATIVDNLRRSSTDSAQIAGGFIGSVLLGTLIGLLGGVFLRRRPAHPAHHVRANEI